MSDPGAERSSRRRAGGAGAVGLLALFTGLVAWCGDPGSDAGSDAASSRTGTTADSTAPFVTYTPQAPEAPEVRAAKLASEDSAWMRFLALHDSALHAPDEDAARLLWAAGTVAVAELPELENRAGHRDERYLRYEGLMPGLFARDEPNGRMAYSGWHFREIERRFPAHELADDAGYAVARLPLFGECEGDFSCVLDLKVGTLSAFLLAHPTSEFAAAAVDSIGESMTWIFAELDGSPRYLEIPEELGVDSTYVITIYVDSVFTSYGQAVDVLPEPLRAEARRRLAPILERWLARRRRD